MSDDATPATEAKSSGLPLKRRRYAVIGLSNRGVASFLRPILGITGGADSALGYDRSVDDYREHAELVAVLDVDQTRAAAVLDSMLPEGHPTVAAYTPDEFTTMLRVSRPDTLIIASPDYTHIDYILPALANDIDVISEKPMVTTAADAARVLEAKRISLASIRVTHNLRFTSRHRKVARMVRAGRLGRVLHVSMDYHVDIQHGASYFLRWNRERAKSGGLTVHKSTHHLDLISWWLGDSPASVYAVGGLDYYGPKSSHRPTSATTPEEVRALDPYYRAQRESSVFPETFETSRNGLYGLPYETQYPAGKQFTLYDEEIDIEDHVAALITFSKGASAMYSVNFSSPWEGYRATITGTDGILEVFVGQLPDGEELPGSGEIIFRPLFGSAEVISVASGEGGHDGADPMMRRALFVGPDEEVEELGLLATAEEGAMAVATGEAIWVSIAEQRVVNVSDQLAQR